jgi:hypothetical protein
MSHIKIVKKKKVKKRGELEEILNPNTKIEENEEEDQNIFNFD